jgi:iron transport multicopper oxidase
MMFTFGIGLLWSLALIQRVKAVDSTDNLMDGGKPDSTKAHLRISNLRLRTTDSSQSGYPLNHNMDPNKITGGSFGQIWQIKTSIAAGVAADQY